jgi:hypothetical protein
VVVAAVGVRPGGVASRVGGVGVRVGVFTFFLATLPDVATILMETLSVSRPSVLAMATAVVLIPIAVISNVFDLPAVTLVIPRVRILTVAIARVRKVAS